MADSTHNSKMASRIGFPPSPSVGRAASGGVPRITAADALTGRDLALQRLFARTRDAAITDLNAQGIEIHGSDMP